VKPEIGADLRARLHRRAEAGRWDVSPEAFQEALDASASHAFAGQTPSPADVERYLQSLHLQDLALATACRRGHEGAWNHFVLEFRPALYRAADAIDRTGAARELADALYGDLFGIEERDGIRHSLLRYFHGRSSLATWLRAVLSQRFVDRVRASRRLEPLPDEDAPVRETAGASASPDRSRLFPAIRSALSAAVASLSPRDRLRLACYYWHGVTLAAIGRQLGEHEATVSRHLTRTRRMIRQEVDRRLRDDHGLDDSEVAECWQTALDDAGEIDVAVMVGAGPGSKGTEPGRSKDRGEV
jgi:RNA polymerase sigma factor (sigma-70 family)